MKRIEIVVKAETGATNTAVAGCLGTYRRRVQRWRDRWFAAEQRMANAELEAASLLLVIRRQKQAQAALLDQAVSVLHPIVCMLTNMAFDTKDRRTS
jgi:hypothetical protein